jgi:hypothetical protein
MAAKRLSSSRSSIFVAVTIVLVVGLAAWISRGAITPLPGRSPAVRVAVLPSPLLLVAAALAGALVVRLSSQSSSWPLGALALSGLTLAPWLPLPVPAAFYTMMGPLTIWLWVLIVVALVASRIGSLIPRALAAIASEPRRAPVLAACAAACVYMVAARQISPQLPTGDEPHYLVIAQSLLTDHDLKIENNYRRGDYRAFYPGELRPDYLQRGRNGEIYSIHAPGLAVILLLPFGLFGYTGAALFLALVSAMASGLAWTAAWRVTRDAAASWFGWAVVGLSAPFVLQSFVVYPDALGAALVMVGLLALIDAPVISTRRSFLAGCALSVLPWLHTRFAAAAFVLALLVIARVATTAGTARRTLAFLAMPILSALCWFGYFYAIYGTVDPRAPYGGYTQSSLGNVPDGVLGLLMDQQFGVMPNAPVYACAFAGLALLAAKRSRLAFELAALLGSYTVVVASYFMWWGGSSSPARFLVPVLLPLAVPAAVWFQHARRPTPRLLGVAALVVSVLIVVTLVGVDEGALVYNNRDGASKLLMWLAPLVDLPKALPSLFFGASSSAAIIAALWAGTLGAVLSAGYFAERRFRDGVGFPVVLGLAGAAAASIALTLAWRVNASSPLKPAEGVLMLLRRSDPDSRQFGLRFGPLRLLRLGAVPAQLTLADVDPAAIAPDEPAAALVDVAAGTYAIEARLRGSAAGTLTVDVDRQLGPIFSWNLAGASGTIRREIDVPVPVHALRFDADPTARQSVERLSVKPVSIRGSRRRIATQMVQHAARYGPAVVYAVHGAFMERGGAWLPGRGQADLVIAPDAPPVVRVFLRNAPVSNRLVFEGSDWHLEIRLEPAEERLVTLPDATDGALAVHVTVDQGARPVDFERDSTDARLLGCWIQTR